MDPLPPPPPRTTTPPMMTMPYEKKSGKPWVFIFVICFLVCLGILYFFFARQANVLQTVKDSIPTIASPTPTPDPTINWQTYSASGSAFSFRFPKEWVYDERKTTLTIAGKLYPGISVAAGIPYTKRQLETQAYLHTQQAPKNNENFTLVYASSPNFEKMSLDAIATDIMDKKALATDTKKQIVLNDLFDAIEVGYGCRAACADIIFKKNSLLLDAGTGANADASIALLRQVLSTLKFK